MSYYQSVKVGYNAFHQKITAIKWVKKRVGGGEVVNHFELKVICQQNKAQGLFLCP